MMANMLESVFGGSAIRAVEDVGDFLIVGLAERALGVGLMLAMKELVANADAARSEFKMPTSESHGKPLNSLEAWIPVHRGFRRDANVMVSIPVLKEPRLKESVVAILPV